LGSPSGSAATTPKNTAPVALNVALAGEKLEINRGHARHAAQGLRSSEISRRRLRPDFPENL
jgi:hypothetical protein